jgi:LmbE family N-acetylglucosaminyl deacetylase
MNQKIIRTALALLFISFLIATPRAQQTTAPATTQGSQEDRIALYQALLDLTNPWTVMCIAAHPDDEDGTSLIVMRRKYGAHTVSLFSTFGEGGQNAIGPELYEELGAIRARETMAAAEIQGSEPYFLGLKDFGYSKSADEAFRVWGHDEALRRMILQIRKLRPDVIITNHSVNNNDHGHHQATARLVVEVFDAAADPKVFPEQLKDGVSTWQVQRLFVRVRGNPGQKPDREGAREEIVTIDPNERDPLRDSVYAEEALRALQKHATQGPWPKTFAEFAARFRSFTGQNAAPGQLPLIRYALVREAKGAAPLPPDSHNFLDGLRLTYAVAREIALPNLANSPMELSRNPSQALEQLINGFRQGSYGVPVDHPADPQRRTLMKQRIEHAFALAAGIHFKVQPATGIVIPDSKIDMSIRISNSGSQPSEIDCKSWIVSSVERYTDENGRPALTARHRASPGATINLSNKVPIPANTPINTPISDHLYEPSGLGVVLNTRCMVEVSGAKFSVNLPSRVDVASPVEIAAVSPSPAAVSTAKAANRSQLIQTPFEVTLINHRDVAFNGRLAALDGTFGNPINNVAVTLAAGEKQPVKFTVAGPVTHVKNNSITFIVQNGKWSSPPTSAEIFSTGANVAPNLRVGYIRGFDFSLPNALAALDVESKELSVSDISGRDLQNYSTIVVDNRAYELAPDLISVNQRLLDYAKEGGTLIVFYHKSNEWNPDERRKRPQLAPYSLVLGDERITDENAPITFLEPQHPLLNFPNKIGQEDFAGWIQERGLYYPKEWDSHYMALLASNDPGEQPLRGGLLVTDYGRGHYIYTSMVWYRQLRAGVPGAYRMLANMVSYGRPTN